MSTPTLCDCGHAPEPSPFSPRYATDTETGYTRCPACAHAAELAYMASADRLTAYLSSDGRTLTTWLGQPLATVTRLHSAEVGFGPDPRRYYIRAEAPDRSLWHGTSRGPGMLCRLRRRHRHGHALFASIR